MELDLRQWLKMLAVRDPTPAGGSLALATLAGAAALASKCARLSGAPQQLFDTFACDFQRFAAQDCDAYAAIISNDPSKTSAAQDMSLRHAQSGLDFLEKALHLKAECKPVLTPDLNAACTLTATSIEILLRNLDVNVSVSAKRGAFTDSGSAALKACHARLARLGS